MTTIMQLNYKKPLQNIYNTYAFASITINGHSDHKTNITIEFTSKNSSRTYMYINTDTFVSIAIYDHPEHKMDISIEFTLKN
jgi:hypothetical protein